MEHQDWKPVLMNKPKKTVTKKQNQIVISKDAKLDLNGDFPQKKKTYYRNVLIICPPKAPTSSLPILPSPPYAPPYPSLPPQCPPPSHVVWHCFFGF